MWFFEGFENLLGDYKDVFIGLKDNYIEALPENKWKYRPLINDGLGIAKFFTYESLIPKLIIGRFIAYIFIVQ